VGRKPLKRVGDRFDGNDEPPGKIDDNDCGSRKDDKQQLLGDDQRVGSDRKQSNDEPSELAS